MNDQPCKLVLWDASGSGAKSGGEEVAENAGDCCGVD